MGKKANICTAQYATITGMKNPEFGMYTTESRLTAVEF